MTASCGSTLDEALERLSLVLGANHPLVARIGAAFVEMAGCVREVAMAVSLVRTEKEPALPEVAETEVTSVNGGSVEGVSADGFGVPLSSARVKELLAAPAAVARAKGAPHDRSVLSTLASHVQVAVDALVFPMFEGELVSFERATESAREAQWAKLSPRGQVQWLDFLVAWGRALRKDATRLGVEVERVGRAFSGVREFVRERPPNSGYVYGLKRDASPRTGDWRTDALERLADVVPSARLALPSQAFTPAHIPEALSPPVEHTPAREVKVPPEWPLHGLVAGRRVVMFGGEVREGHRVELEEAFGFDSLEWVPHHKPRLAQSLCERAARGSVDLVLVNKFVSHADTAALERTSSVPVIYLRAGYGVTAVRLAIEEQFSKRATG